MHVKWSGVALFGSGVFFGGAFDHFILAAKGSAVTPYGVYSGVVGNWALAGIDLALAAVLFLLQKGRAKK